MGFLNLILHLLNFCAPAVCVALLMVLFARVFIRKQAAMRIWQAQAAINFVVCLVALLVGLVFFGNDGKMATYCLLVLGCASSQWWMLR